MNDSELILLGNLEYAEAKHLKAALEERGVELTLIRDPETCVKGGCKPQFEVYARSPDLDLVKEFMRQERSRSLGGLEIDGTIVDEGFDPDKERARCPACGTEFSTQLTECPDCGLGFVVG